MLKKEEEIQMKKQEGITLVALVITIIVLLILAGVSISLVVGNNGVLTQASNAVTTNNVAGIREKVVNSLTAVETSYWTKWSSNTAVRRAEVYGGEDGGLKTELDSNLTGYTVTVSGNVVGGDCTISAEDAAGTFTFTLVGGVDANDGTYTLKYGSGTDNASDAYVSK